MDEAIQTFLGKGYTQEILSEEKTFKIRCLKRKAEILQSSYSADAAFEELFPPFCTFLNNNFPELKELTKEEHYPPFSIPQSLAHLRPWGKILSLSEVQGKVCRIYSIQKKPKAFSHLEAKQAQEDLIALKKFPQPYATRAHSDIEEALACIHRIHQDTDLTVCFMFQNDLMFTMLDYCLALLLKRRIITLSKDFENCALSIADGTYKGPFAILTKHDLCIHTADTLWTELLNNALSQNSQSQSFFQQYADKLLKNILSDITPNAPESPMRTLFQIGALFFYLHEIPGSYFSPTRGPQHTYWVINFVQEQMNPQDSSAPLPFDTERALHPLISALPSPNLATLKTLTVACKQAWLGVAAHSAAHCTLEDVIKIWDAVAQRCLAQWPQFKDTLLRDSPLNFLKQSWAHQRQLPELARIYCLNWNSTTCSIIFRENVIIITVPSTEKADSITHFFDCLCLRQSIITSSRHLNDVCVEEGMVRETVHCSLTEILNNTQKV